MRRTGLLFLALIFCLCLILSACGSGPASNENTGGNAVENSVQEPEGSGTDNTASDAGKTLVVYFSATGTTKGVAEKIAKITGADLYEIVPAQPYTSADLNYNDKSSRAAKEQDDKSARPEIAGEKIDLSGYSTIYIGFPIWFGKEPRIMDTFAESYDFTGKTIIPFCTSGSSGIENSGSNMEKLAGSGTWLEGKRHSGSISEEELKAWIDGFK